MNFGIDNAFPDSNVAPMPYAAYSLPTQPSNTPREREEQYQDSDANKVSLASSTTKATNMSDPSNHYSFTAIFRASICTSSARLPT